MSNIGETEAELRTDIEIALGRLAALISPEETVAYVERIAERMREEIDGD